MAEPVFAQPLLETACFMRAVAVVGRKTTLATAEVWEPLAVVMLDTRPIAQTVAATRPWQTPEAVAALHQNPLVDKIWEDLADLASA